ncbi:MAG TPA: DUF2141 domain-containing protein [Rhizomicrobium sp.]|jgi:uncharacterized protein (DUF2141 family)|nr:DUF2141 domain-containing protein [Rhizomicrobium sp.]
MRYLAFACALFLLLPALARAEDKAVLTVTVQHISSIGGDLRLALYDRKAFADDDAAPVADKVVAAKPWVEIVTFDPVAPGTYAVKMFQDANRNEKFDFNWLGIPAERYGFSNNAGPDWMHLAAPGFDAAKIVLKPGANSISIWLH